MHPDRDVRCLAGDPVAELAGPVVAPVEVLPVGQQRARVGERRHQLDHVPPVEPGYRDRRSGVVPAAVAQVAVEVLPAGVDGAGRVVQRVRARPGHRGHVGQRQPGRGGVELRIAQAKLSAAIVAPAPDIAVGVHGQPGIERHRVGRDGRDPHPGREAHPHRHVKRVAQAAVAQLTLAAQAPGVQAAVGQQRVVGRVRGADLGHGAGQGHVDRRGQRVHVARGVAEQRAPVPEPRPDGRRPPGGDGGRGLHLGHGRSMLIPVTRCRARRAASGEERSRDRYPQAKPHRK